MRLVESRLLPRVLAGICAVGATAAFVGLGVGVGQAEPQAKAEQKTLTTSNPRPNGGTVTKSHGASPYDYAPAIIKEGNKYRMWWCSAKTGTGPEGDDIFYAESTDLNTFSTPKAVFTGNAGNHWDNTHTCDPSVVKTSTGYYMYYGGAVNEGITKIGLATSPDGITWARANGGEPIITPANEVTHAPYGAGQPSVVFKDGKFHIIFTDTTGKGSLPVNGAGQFAWRSADPTFKTGTEVFTAQGWKPLTKENSRSFMVANAFSADWQYSNELKSFIIAHNNDATHTTLTFLGGENLAEQPYKPITVVGPWADGPGLASTPDKHALSAGPCGSVTIDLIMATVGGPPRELKHKGLDIRDADVCPSPSPSASPSSSPSSSPSASPSGSPSPSVPGPSVSVPVPPTAAPSATPSKSPVVSVSPSKTVKPTPGAGASLPTTGSRVLVGAGIGVALLAGGALLYIMARRRNTTTA